MNCLTLWTFFGGSLFPNALSLSAPGRIPYGDPNLHLVKKIVDQCLLVYRIVSLIAFGVLHDFLSGVNKHFD